ncbi:hypothetical protein X777_04153 [Ooceraea biroi]|uniref:DUF4218 domain-containing protein n=1 Tax=Ooceraea biroi TaxID=2015173 RepID=A0A026WKV9_OOCBI|nr:hypothetical protein X777_04153 [Ooceraea biroi]
MIDFSTDGATLDEQSKIQIWPIQIRIANIPRSKPEIVGVWQGASKPTNAQELFQYFVDEVRDVLNRGGIVFRNQLQLIKLRCFLADSPARAFVLGHRGHGSLFPCSKCWIRGNWLRRGVVAYRDIRHRPRTDKEHRQHIDGEHHTDSDSVLLTNIEATENRQLLLYTAPVVYYGLVDPAAYKHFLLLHSAIRVLVSSSLSEDSLDFAHRALRMFVNRAEDIYGPEFLSYITHCLLHIVDDVRRFGSLDELSMFPYENNMTYYRKVCRKPHQHLQQIINR